jgi:hypothetical protein
MALRHSPKIVTDGLVLAVDAANTRSYPGSGSTWSDLSGSGNHGTISGDGVVYSSDNNGTLVFDGVGDDVEFGPGATSVFTYSAWFNTDVVSDGFRTILGYAGSNYSMIILENDASHITFWASDGLNLSYRLGTPAISTGRWYNVVFIREGSNITGGYKAYLDSVFTGSLNSGTQTLSTNDFHIGGRPDTSQFFDGKISSVSVYNRALSASEIAQNYNALKGRFGL